MAKHQQNDKEKISLLTILTAFFTCGREIFRRSPRSALCVTVVAIMVGLLSSTIEVLLYRAMVDSVSRHALAQAISWWTWLMGERIITAILSSAILDNLPTLVAENVFEDNKRELVAHYGIPLDHKAASNAGTRKKVEILMNEVNTAIFRMPYAFFRGVRMFSMVIPLLWILGHLPWWLIFLSLGAVVPAFLVNLLLGSSYYTRLRNASPVYMLQVRTARALMDEDLIETIHRYPAGARELDNQLPRVKQEFEKILRDLLFKRGLLSPFAAAIIVGVVGYINYYAINIAGNIAEFVLYATAVVSLTTAMNSLLEDYVQVADGAHVLEKIRSFKMLQPSIRQEASSQEEESSEEDSDIALEFDNVVYSYPSSLEAPASAAPQEALRGVSFQIRKGQTVLLVGKNGAGKTTVGSLAERFDDPTSGEIRIEGKNLRALAPEDVRKQVVTLGQSEKSVPATIRTNIEFGCPDIHNQQALDTAIRLSEFESVLAKKPQGLDTLLGGQVVGGTNLSGGELQRMLLARALYYAITMECPLLKFDEPTSAMDALATKDLFASIFGHFKGKTILLTTHVLSLALLVDQVIVLDAGQVVDMGTHEILMERCALYREMWNAQAKGYQA